MAVTIGLRLSRVGRGVGAIPRSVPANATSEAPSGILAPQLTLVTRR
jgi:hypothetical protein